MQAFFGNLRSNYIVLVLGALALLMLVHFFVQYVGRGLILRAQLIRLNEAVARQKGQPPQSMKANLAAIFRGSRAELAWREFEETLHEQYSSAGDQQPIAVRATLPAEAFINLDTVVDPWIGSEYFKHLPGILTGLGIIGTFTGLIQGLIHFDPSVSDPALLRESVHGLFSHVQSAFSFSALAIACAIGATAIEKWLYSSCAKWLSRISQALDGLFRTGVGEEYLSSLVQASQNSSTQVRQLKEDMVVDLKDLLTGLANRQIAATQKLSQDLGQRIDASLREPLAEIAKMVREVSHRETDALGAVLEKLMASFMTQMRETVGQQMGELNGLLHQTAQTMGGVELAVKHLVMDIQRAGQESTSGVQRAVLELLNRLGEHQRAIADANAASLSAARETIDRVASQTAMIIERLSSASISAAAAMDGLERAADRMATVTSEFATLESQALQSAQGMQQASASLAAASRDVANCIGSLVVASTRLGEVAQAASIETDARNRLSKDLQDVISKTQAASEEFADLAQQVRNTLETSIGEFGGGVSKVLSEHLRSYQKQLGDAVGMLQGALVELADYAGTLRE